MPEDVGEQADKELGRLERLGEQAARPARSGPTSTGCCRCRGRSAPTSGWTRSSPARCSTPTTPASRTSRTASSSTSRSRSCAWSAASSRGQALRRDPHPDRPARHRQDLDRRVDRPRDRPRVRPHVARRRPRRGRDPRPPAHVRRRAPGPPGARAARRRDDEPGDHARRGRQGRRRLARRPERGPARGARPGAEPRVPRPLPRRRDRPVAGALHRHRQRRRDDPRPAAGPHGGHPLRRLHRRGEGRHRPRLPVAAPARAQRPARGRGRDQRRAAATDRREYTREAGVRNLERELGHRPAQDRDEDRVGEGRGARRSSTWTPSATRSAARRSGRRRRCAPRCPAWPPACRDRHGRRRPVRRGDLDEGQGRPRAHRPARRRDEGVGAHRALLRPRPRGGAGHRRGRLRGPRVPRPRPGGRDPEGRPERRRHDGDRARVAAERAARSSTRSA